ncbi:hypothetical protein BDD12DRAFT_814930 [Trichophaea hybrida]|nr:hypothetical protein BDD12DRAFT_814930 [Trichophaea hybrida]
MDLIAVGSLIISVAEFALHAGEVASKETPDVGSELKEKTRWLQCTTKNQTQFNILLENTYFDSGRYWDTPGSIDPFTQDVFSLCNGDNSAFTGVSGGTSYKIVIDSQHTFHFAIGWTNPYAGAFKAGVVESNKAEDGYNNATVTGNSIQSPQYQGKDKDGNASIFYFHISASPSQNARFCINQVRVDA